MGFRGRGHDEAVEGLAVSDQRSLVPASASPTSAPRTGNQIAGLRRRLVRRESFRRLWIGQTISVFGDQITLVALPLVAILIHHAGPRQMGILTAAGWTPHLLVSLFAGAWIDSRSARRVTMIASDVGRALLIASIPAAAAFHHVAMSQLYIVAFLVGVLTVFFDQSYTPLFQLLVPPEEFVDAISLVTTSRAASQVGGPGIAGLLVSLLGAPVAMLADAASFICSAFFLFNIRSREPAIDRTSLQGARRRIAEGLRYVLRQPMVRASLAAVTTANFFTWMLEALLVLFLATSLRLSPTVIGGVFAVGAVGGLAGAILAPRITRVIGFGRAIVAGGVLFPSALALVPMAAGGRTVAAGIVAAGQFLSGLGVMLFDVNNNSLYALLIPYRLRARGSGTVRFFAYGVRPLGALAGGFLGAAIGLRPTLWIAVAGAVGSVIWLLSSPIPHLQTPPRQVQ